MMSRDVSAPLSTNPHLLRWVRKMADLDDKRLDDVLEFIGRSAR